MIDVIIPAYNAHKTIEETLSSIAYQDKSELVTVYIIDDASSKSYSDIIEFYSNFIKIKELRISKNSGPGVARQYGIDNSKSDYIIFIDSDDVFADCYSITTLFNAIKDGDNDLVISNISEETNNGFITKKNDRVWLHGKIYKRDFLIKNNIRFNDSRANEDNGFNQLFLLHDPKVKVIDAKTYIWRNNQQSITRINNYRYKYEGLEGYIYNINWALDQAIKNKCDKNKIGKLAFSSLVFIYTSYLEFMETDEVSHLVDKTKPIRKKTLEYPVSDSDKLKLFESQIKAVYTDESKKYLLMPKILFNDFISLIDQEIKL